MEGELTLRRIISIERLTRSGKASRTAGVAAARSFTQLTPMPFRRLRPRKDYQRPWPMGPRPPWPKPPIIPPIIRPRPQAVVKS